MLDCVRKNFFVSSITRFLFMIMSSMLFCVFTLWFDLVVKFTLLSIIHPFRKFDLSWGGPSFCTSKFYLFFILAYAENFMCPAPVFKKFEFRRPCFGGNTPLWYPKLSSNFDATNIFILATLNTSYFQLKTIKTLNFERPCLGGGGTSQF